MIEHIICFAPFGFICFEDIVGNSYLYWVLAFAVLVSLLFLLKACSLRKAPPVSPVLPVSAPFGFWPNASESASAVIRSYRGCVYVATIMCILGRDLQGFRVSFSKAYYRGTGLMDVGVGCFLFIMGLTGPTARTKPEDFSREK